MPVSYPAESMRRVRVIKVDETILQIAMFNIELRHEEAKRCAIAEALESLTKAEHVNILIGDESAMMVVVSDSYYYINFWSTNGSWNAACFKAKPA